MSETSAKRVLIIDNDINVRDTLVDMVRDMGHQAVAIERATRATSLLADESIDAILLDLHMPGPHGQDLLRFWKKRHIRVPPTIIVSGYLQEEAIGELLQLGVCGIIAKPFDAKRLRDELGRVLEGRDEQRIHFCPDCGTGTKEADRFCRQCGSNLDRQRNCPACQQPFTPGDRFCGDCGKKLAQ